MLVRWLRRAYGTQRPIEVSCFGAAGATSPRPLRGEVGLRSNPGEGHGTYGAKIKVRRTGTDFASMKDVDITSHVILLS
ncbi:protein of unknown function [Bradyrhizobium sp. ORS 285]|nr:hypothetical protein BRAO285_1050037 [Bradyrhizobium sp. ORS 285]SMX60697.1 protein of unknown function [Bradyrhizobium sp. ORS 285]